MPRGKHTSHRRGTAHPRWRGGTSIDKRNGYVRYTSGRWRGRYVHRVCTLLLLAEVGAQCWWPRDETGMPYVVDGDAAWAFEIHHRDFNKTHNTPGNLLLLDYRLHRGVNADGRKRDECGRWRVRAKRAEQAQRALDASLVAVLEEAPDWVTVEGEWVAEEEEGATTCIT